MRRSSQTNLCGFTLLEILITVVVLSTGLVLVLQGLHSVLHVWNMGVHRTRSTMAAQEQFACIRYEALQGVAPESGGGITIEEDFAGHAGLYRVLWRDADENVAVGGAYEMLVYIAPDRGDVP